MLPDNKPHSYLNIQIRFNSTQVVISMEDNGVGIDEKHQHKLFNMFFRASDQSEGSGLGLYIVKQAVAKLYGTITFDSKTSHGTRFVICFPCKHKQTA